MKPDDPVFPIPGTAAIGLTVRELFAAIILAGTAGAGPDDVRRDLAADHAVRQADALIARLSRD